MTSTYVALLRGINVGGKNRVLMADLRACFEWAGFADVRTYIQSGNVMFRAGEGDRVALTEAIERALGDTFGYQLTVALRDLAEMDRVIERAPAGFGHEPEVYRYDVMYVLPPLTPEDALEALSLKEGIDTAWGGPGVVYTTRLIERASRSGLSKLAAHSAYKRLTVRNWNTTRKLFSMMQAY